MRRKQQRGERAADPGEAPELDVVPECGPAQRGARGGQGIDRRNFCRVGNPLPQRRARRCFLGGGIEVCKPFPPRADGPRKAVVGLDPPLGRRVLGVIEQAHHIIGGHYVIGTVSGWFIPCTPATQTGCGAPSS